MDAACNTVEETWVVGGVNCHQRRPARRIDRRCDGEISRPRLVDMARVALQHVVRLSYPIRFGQPLGVSGEFGGRPGQRLLQQFLLHPYSVCPAALFVAKPQHLFCRFEQLGQQLALPAVPHTGANRADVDNGEDEQQTQPLRRLYDAGKVEHSLKVRQIALEGGRGHQQMLAHQPGHGFGFCR